ncbi:prepilin peptidase [Candidatus Williamhamiltonella defendens]|uniref:prepilin peptidase n=1 Tax=Candidatus Williamhamiltonella defendens TaxID=138072 RepID=UPI001583AEA6|nr:A24 family peptidase [Candidatus Hamiltonella defensa]
MMIQLKMLENMPFIFVVIFIFGLVIGSFLNVVIYRYPKMLEYAWRLEAENELGIPSKKTERFDFILPPSHCIECQTPLRFYDKIPLLSWLYLKGQCRFCRKKIGLRYPAVELFTGIAFTLPVIFWGFSLWALAMMGCSVLLIILSLIDVDHLWLPNSLNYALLWLGLLVALLGYSPLNLSQAVSGVMIGYFALWSLYWGFKFLSGREGLGSGDFLLFGALGAWVGVQNLIYVALISSFSGILFTLLSGRTKDKIPFGIWLALGGWSVLLFPGFMGLLSKST